MHQKASQGQQDRSLLISIVLNFLITIVQVIGGLLSNSLSLISDALHNLSDGTALLIAWFASRISRKQADLSRTFGYKRAEILAAFINAIVLVAISIYLFYEAWQRLINPEEVNSRIMLIAASFGLAANLISVLLLRKHSRENLNIRAAYLHLFADTLSSVAVIAGGILMWLYGWYWIDPVVTLLIGLYILKETVSILRETINILMQAVPRDKDVEQISSDISRIEGIRDIHHVHLWRLTDQFLHFECHVNLDQDIKLSQCQPLRQQIEEILAGKHDIHHVTTQFEFSGCDENGIIHKEDHNSDIDQHK